MPNVHMSIPGWSMHKPVHKYLEDAFEATH